MFFASVLATGYVVLDNDDESRSPPELEKSDQVTNIHDVLMLAEIVLQLVFGCAVEARGELKIRVEKLQVTNNTVTVMTINSLCNRNV